MHLRRAKCLLPSRRCGHADYQVRVGRRRGSGRRSRVVVQEQPCSCSVGIAGRSRKLTQRHQSSSVGWSSQSRQAGNTRPNSGLDSRSVRQSSECAPVESARSSCIVEPAAFAPLQRPQGSRERVAHRPPRATSRAASPAVVSEVKRGRWHHVDGHGPQGRRSSASGVDLRVTEVRRTDRRDIPTRPRLRGAPGTSFDPVGLFRSPREKVPSEKPIPRTDCASTPCRCYCCATRIRLWSYATNSTPSEPRRQVSPHRRTQRQLAASPQQTVRWWTDHLVVRRGRRTEHHFAQGAEEISFAKHVLHARLVGRDRQVISRHHGRWRARLPSAAWRKNLAYRIHVERCGINGEDLNAEQR